MAMNTRLSKKQMFFNKVKLTKDDNLYIGIDVHKESYGVALWFNETPAIDFIMPADTDQLDAKTLARYAAKGLLRPIAIPTRRQEADRQLTRTRDQLVSKQSEVKLQIKSFLLQHGIEQPRAVHLWKMLCDKKPFTNIA
jgi:hypothetical protein